MTVLASQRPEPGCFDHRATRFVQAIARKFAKQDADVDDITQDALMAAHRHQASYRGEARYTTWLYQVTCRAALMHLRRTRRIAREVPTSVQETSPVGFAFGNTPAPAPSPHDQALCDELLALARARALKLGAKYAEAFELRYVLGMNESEMAAALGVPLATVKTRVFRARRALSDAPALPPCLPVRALSAPAQEKRRTRRNARTYVPGVARNA